MALGASEGGRLTDAAFTASSQFIGFAAHEARLNGPAGWTPLEDDAPTAYLQVDLGSSFGVCAIATQGCISFAAVTYTLSFSLDGGSFQGITEGDDFKVTLCLKPERKGICFVAPTAENQGIVTVRQAAVCV